jgi:predicted nucleic acid-binding protein
VGEHVSKVLLIAREHNLSVYDAAYLELSIRHGASLATLDGKLRKAAKNAGVEIFAGEASK